MTLLYIVKFKLSGNLRAYTQDQFDDKSADPFFFNGGLEINVVRFGKDIAAIKWLAKNGIKYSSE